MKNVCEKGIIRSLIGYSSYQNKKETIFNEYGVRIPRSTILYHEQKWNNTLMDYCLLHQYKKIKESIIQPSGVYTHNELYVFIKKELYVCMTLMDHKNKLMMYEYIVHKDDF